MRKTASVIRIAMRLFNCGSNKVWLNPTKYEEFKAVNTIEGVKALIEKGFIAKKEDKFNSRAKARARAEAKSKGRHMGRGSRKGTKNARMSDKTIWTKTIRSMRNTLKEMKDEGELSCEEYHDYRMKAKGNFFRRNVAFMKTHIEQEKAKKLRLEELKSQAAALKVEK